MPITQFDKSKTFCFTGHRTEFWKEAGGARSINYEQVIYERIASAIEAEYALGIRNFIAGGATGVDHIGAVAVINKKEWYPDIRLVLAIPYKEYSIGSYSFGGLNFTAVVEKADSVYYVCNEAPPSNMYGDRKRWIVDKLFQRNDWMIDNSCGVIAVYDTTATKGGPKYLVDKARRLKKKVLVMDVLRN